jgi:hypothetical protein
VDVVPLGPQPLRGLDAPVPLYQLSPLGLKSRQFAALRLDVEIEVDDDSTDGSATAGDGTTQLSAADDTVETHFERLVRRSKDGAQHKEYLWRLGGFLTTLLRTSAMSWRKDTVKHVMKKWHIKQRVAPAGAKEPAEKTMQYDILTLAVRVGLASEEAARAMHQRGGSDTRSMGTDGGGLFSSSLNNPSTAVHGAARSNSINRSSFVRRFSSSVPGGPSAPNQLHTSTNSNPRDEVKKMSASVVSTESV